jgi:hypothetical protein
MTKLIVEEGGARRAFRMGKGVLTVGSGAAARLRLASPGVAEVHFELELSEEGVRLRPRPGVAPLSVGGAATAGEVALLPGKKVALGAVRLWIEPEAEPLVLPAPAAPAPGRPAPAPRGRRAASPRASRREGEGRRPGGVPAWLVPILVVAAAGLLLALWFRGVKEGAGDEGLAKNHMRAARQAVAAGHFQEALAELARIAPTDLSAERAAEVRALEAEVRAAEAEVEQGLANQSGTRYLDTLLKKYEGVHLQGSPEPARVRLFLKRCRTFRERWPTHPERDWVERQEARFHGFVDLAAPPTWADVRWEVKDLTDGSPRNYVAALGLLDELLARVSGAERTEAEALRDALVAGRPEYARDRLYQAKFEFERKEDASKAVWWLVHNIAWLGDEALANENARFLVKMPELAGHLLGYREAYPERYAAVLANPIVRAWAEETGFEP